MMQLKFIDFNDSILETNEEIDSLTQINLPAIKPTSEICQHVFKFLLIQIDFDQF
jgi:hypothetical protein